MQNITQRIEGNKLILEIDMAQDFGPSQSQKTLTVANSGFAKVDHPEIAGVGFKLNVWKGLKKDAATA